MLLHCSCHCSPGMKKQTRICVCKRLCVYLTRKVLLSHCAVLSETLTCVDHWLTKIVPVKPHFHLLLQAQHYRHQTKWLLQTKVRYKVARNPALEGRTQFHWRYSLLSQFYACQNETWRFKIHYIFVFREDFLNCQNSE